MKYKFAPFLAFFISFCIRYIFYEDYIFTAIGISFSFGVATMFLIKLGNSLPIKEYILLIASFQWIVGAKISYTIGKSHYKYYMYVDEETYMSFVVPGVLLFALGLSLINAPLSINRVADYMEDESARAEAKKIGINLIGVGLLVTFTTQLILLPGLGFFLYLASLLIYVGIGHLMLAFPERRWHWFFAAILYIFMSSLLKGLFHELFLVAGFLVFFLFTNRTSMLSKLGILVLGGLSVYVLQVVKKDYRKFAWSGAKNQNPVEVFFTLVADEFFSQPELNKDYVDARKAGDEKYSEVNNRLNQGWIISKTLDNIPKNKDFLGGESVARSIEASILPRFLAPNKKGGEYAKVVFQEVTGLKLTRQTSMGLSVIGEFYANYGIAGAWIALLLYGMFLAFIIKTICNSVGKGSPLILFWFILFFFQTVKAESNFITVFNHLIKSIFFFLILKLLMKQIGVKIIND